MLQELLFVSRVQTDFAVDSVDAYPCTERLHMPFLTRTLCLVAAPKWGKFTYELLRNNNCVGVLGAACVTVIDLKHISWKNVFPLFTVVNGPFLHTRFFVTSVKTLDDKQHKKYSLTLPRYFIPTITLFVQRLHACARKMPSCSTAANLVPIVRFSFGKHQERGLSPSPLRKSVIH